MKQEKKDEWESVLDVFNVDFSIGRMRNGFKSIFRQDHGRWTWLFQAKIHHSNVYGTFLARPIISAQAL